MIPPHAMKNSFLLLVLCAALQGCGTDAITLLRDDNELTWQAELVLAEAEELPLEVEETYYQADSDKTEACRPIYRSVKYRFERELLGETPSFAKSLGNDFMLLVALIVPVGPVANCAEAYEQYRERHLALRERVNRLQAAN